MRRQSPGGFWIQVGFSCFIRAGWNVIRFVKQSFREKIQLFDKVGEAIIDSDICRQNKDDASCDCKIVSI